MLADQVGRARLLVTRSVCAIGLVVAACGSPQDTTLAELRDRLKQDARLSDAEVARVRDEVGKRVTGRTIRVKDGDDLRALDASQTELLLEVLTLPAGVYDEGVQREGGVTLRVLNGPARSDTAEIEAVQRLWINADTLLPVRYEHAYALPGYGQERRFDLTY